MSRRPSELRDAPSRPPVVWTLAVYSTFFSWVAVGMVGGARTMFVGHIRFIRNSQMCLPDEISTSFILVATVARQSIIARLPEQ